MGKFVDLTDQDYGDLKVVGRANNDSWGRAMWWCKCKCGRYTLVLGACLRSGHTKSCGCLQKEHTIECNSTHKMTNTRPYKIWSNMLQRDENENNPAYPRYGERGITVCERWHKFENFWEDMKEGYADNLTLERIDNNKGYCPENCCWADRKKQANNRGNNVVFTINGKTQTLAEHIEDPEINIYGLNKNTVRKRRSIGWPEEEIFATPKGGKRPVYTINGKTQTLAEHIEDPEINIYDLEEGTVRSRIRRGWTPEKAFSTPVGGKRNGQEAE